MIEFPKEEYSEILERLNKGLVIYTTRVSDEVNKYKLGYVYDSCFGRLKVVSLEHLKNFLLHPFINELNSIQKKEIKDNLDNRGYDLVGLSLE